MLDPGEEYRVILGDCIEEMARMPSASIAHAVFSPPFSLRIRLHQRGCRHRQQRGRAARSQVAFLMVLSWIAPGDDTGPGSDLPLHADPQAQAFGWRRLP